MYKVELMPGLGSQRIKTGDWAFKNYDMNTSYLVSIFPSCVSCAFQDMRSLLRVRAREMRDHSSLSSFAHTCSSAFFSVLYDMY